MTTAEKLVKLSLTLPEPLLMEVLDFAEFLNQRHQAAVDSTSANERPLSELLGGLEKAPVFQEDPVVIQRKIRDEWD